jgi:hypothetical protein
MITIWNTMVSFIISPKDAFQTECLFMHIQFHSRCLYLKTVHCIKEIKAMSAHRFCLGVFLNGCTIRCVKSAWTLCSVISSKVNTELDMVSIFLV